MSQPCSSWRKRKILWSTLRVSNFERAVLKCLKMKEFYFIWLPDLTLYLRRTQTLNSKRRPKLGSFFIFCRKHRKKNSPIPSKRSKWKVTNCRIELPSGFKSEYFHWNSRLNDRLEDDQAKSCTFFTLYYLTIKQFSAFKHPS